MKPEELKEPVLLAINQFSTESVDLLSGSATHPVKLPNPIWPAAPSFWHPGLAAELHDTFITILMIPQAEQDETFTGQQHIKKPKL